MQHKARGFACLAFAAGVSFTASAAEAGGASRTVLPQDVLDWVDTKVGTDMGGNTHPGALWPFGMVQPGPDTTARADGDYQSDCSGYSENHEYLMGFTQTHLSGTGCTDLMDFLLMPFTGADPDPAKRLTRRMDKRNEKGRPGYYTVTIEDGGILCELTASRRVAYHRYTSAKGGTLKVFLDAQAGTFAWWRKDRPKHRVTFAESTYDEQTAVFEGHNRVNCWNDNRDVFAKIAFSRRPDAVRELAANGRNGRRFVLDFKLPPKGSVVAKAAISSVDADGARANFAADPAGFDFDARLADCRAAWRAELGRIVATGDETRLRNFYAALYHTMVQPNLFSDVDGRVRFSDQQWGAPFTGKVRKAEGFDVSTTFSTWDTFRATHPWYTIFNPGVVDGFCKSMMLSYGAIGKLPIWQMFGGENYCMPGVHSIPVIADAMLKGLTDLDPQAVAKAMDVSQVLRCAEEPAYDKLGYWAYETAGASVSRTLESGIDDYATMKVAELAGDAELARRYAKRAGYYRNLFDPATGCMRARSRKGNFREPFDPYKQKPTEEDKRNGIPNDYTEGGAWQYAFHVLQDPSGLMKLHGGPDRFGDALEKLFTDNTEVSADKATGECSGRIGQFALGNEHDQHVPYLFQAANRPWRTEEIVRELCDRYFRPTPDGLCGNDDCGQISAWYLFACLGFYPVNPVGGDYFLGAPQLDRIQVKVKGEGEQWRIFTVVAKNLSAANKYVKAVTLNGRPYDGKVLKHADIVRGGELVFEMSDVPKFRTGAGGSR